MKKILSLFSLILLIVSSTHAQVTIGSNNPPEKAALLDMKEIVSKDGGYTTNKGGLILPRVNLEKKYQLYPFIRENGYDPLNFDNPSYNPDLVDSEYAKEKPAHTGLIVYNLVDNEDEELCLGLNQWDGEKWNCFQTKLGNAIAEITNCDSVKFHGQYLDKTALNSSNFMTIPLNVTKTGAYNITVMPDPENGYYFIVSGVFLATGYYYVTIPASGTPIKYTPDSDPGDLMKITFNGKPMDTCDPLYLKIEDSSRKPLYIMDCSKTKVRGVYKLNEELDIDDNYIEMTLNVDLEAVGAKYIIETNTVDGIYFKDEGLLTSTTMNIKLKGYGVPNSLDDKHFTITSNSKKTVATCKATVIMVIPKKRVYTIGTSAGFGYNLAAGSTCRTILTKPVNFGTLETSTIRTDIDNYDFIISDINGIPTSTQVTNIVNELTTKRPDIVLITQDFYIPDDNNSANKELQIRLMNGFVDYLNNRGVVIFCWEGNPSDANGGAKRFFSYLFANSTITQKRGQGAGSIYKFNNIDDEILNGPFGDIRGKYWGEDASWCMSLINLPLGELTVYSYGDDYSGNTGSTNNVTGNPVVFRHNTLNLFYFGDGGFISAPDAALTNGNGYGGNKTICPFAFDPATFKPKAKSNYGANVSYDVYNSVAFFNVFAWAIKKAQFDGINTIK